MSSRIGIDTGGTFTDLILFEERSGKISVVKQPSTPDRPEQAVLEAIHQSGADLTTVSLIVLGTTIGANAVLQRKGTRVIYLTTQGFEDIPFIQRVDKKDPYDLQWQKPEPFVRRSDCLGIRERVNSLGSCIAKPSARELERIKTFIEKRWARQDGGMAVAVNMLFSYANPANEEALRDFLNRHFPEIPLSFSSKVSPIWREYERASTTIIDAFLKPLMIRFFNALERSLLENGYSNPCAVMKSNGGQMTSSAVRERPIDIMLSGLSGGVIAGKYFGELCNCRNLITFDMGGTSTDVATVVEGVVGYTTEYEVDFNIPVLAPFIDMKTIGAGGGSIARIDPGGLLRVGPNSAGAAPGPVCYDRGGEEVTLTDANLVLGRLNPDNFLGGKIKLNSSKARQEVARQGEKLGLTPEETALAIVDLANENMANAIRVLTLERGLDPREFSLVAFGGAGPLHASDLAASLNLKEILVPPHPGLASAFGTLVADLRVDKRWTHYYTSDAVDLEEINRQFDVLTEETIWELQSEGSSGTSVVNRSISMRYAGQNYERDITVPAGRITPVSLQALIRAFHEEHERFYGYSFKEEIIEFIHFSVTAIGESTKPGLPKMPPGKKAESISHRNVYFRGTGFVGCPIYRRESLPAGAVIQGPAVIEEMDSTTLLHPGQSLTVSPEGIFRISGKRSSQSEKERTLQGRANIDIVALAIIHNNLVSITREMGVAMMRTAYSPIFSESKNFACALFNREGEMIAQGEFCPAQLGAIPITVKWILEEIGVDGFAPGDVIIHNDPYRGGCHMPEHMLLKPVFYRGTLAAFAAVIGHLAEIGAKAIGSFASDATDVFQEGLRLPPVKLMRQGEYVKDVWKIVLANHRTPRNTWGDFHAMLGALNVAEQRLQKLMNTYGSEYMLETAEELIRYSERLMRKEISSIPDGECRFEERMEDDGITDRPYHIRVLVLIDRDRMIVDFTESDSQARGPINATYGVTASATYNALLQITGAHIPRNAGCYQPVQIIAPPGSIVNVRYPGPSVGGNTETQPRIVSAVLGALGQALPEKIMAAEGATSCNFLFGGVHPRTDRFYVHYHFEASGWGGRFRTDGNSVQNHIHGNCRNTPIEIFETLYPFVIKEYRLIRDSGGPGRRRGGLASRRVMEVAAPAITVSVMMDHVKEGAWGAFGGQAGGLAGIWIRRKGEKAFKNFSETFGTVSLSKFANVVVREGDRIIIDSAGGGGYGDPIEREPELVLNDVQQGFVSPEMAWEKYRVRVVQRSPEEYILEPSSERHRKGRK